jgi:hypothetical protein
MLQALGEAEALSPQPHPLATLSIGERLQKRKAPPQLPAERAPHGRQSHHQLGPRGQLSTALLSARAVASRECEGTLPSANTQTKPVADAERRKGPAGCVFGDAMVALRKLFSNSLRASRAAPARVAVLNCRPGRVIATALTHAPGRRSTSVIWCSWCQILSTACVGLFAK